MQRKIEEVDMREVARTKSNSFKSARGRDSVIVSDHDKRLADVYALLGKPAPTINRVADVRAAAAPLVAHYSSEVAARRLAEAALEPDADLTALVTDAIREHATALAWDSLALQLSRAGSGIASQHYDRARIDAFRDLEPLARKTIGDLKRAVKKLDAVEDVFNAQQVVDAQADTAAVSSIRRALTMLGTIARLDLYPKEGLRGLLRLVDVPADIDDYTDPTAKAIREIRKVHERMFDYDRLLVDVARGRHNELALVFAADDAEVNAREQRLDAILALPVPKVKDPLAKARRRAADGPRTR